jgi:hypothetical protein
MGVRLAWDRFASSAACLAVATSASRLVVGQPGAVRGVLANPVGYALSDCAAAAAADAFTAAFVAAARRSLESGMAFQSKVPHRPRSCCDCGFYCAWSPVVGTEESRRRRGDCCNTPETPATSQHPASTTARPADPSVADPPLTGRTVYAFCIICGQHGQCQPVMPAVDRPGQLPQH